jgi:4-hydroxybenzoate polyprenyltransferase
MRPRAVRQLLGEGSSYLLGLISGRPRAIGIPVSRFVRAVISSLRPHYFVFPGAAALVGAAAAPRVEAPWRVALVAFATALSWGIGQLINDLIDVEADRVDAPHRAGVQGLLPEGPTVAVAMLLGLVVTLAVAGADPSLLPLLFASALLLFVYHPAKTIPALGNVAHGALMSSVVALGFVAAVPSAPLFDSLVRAAGAMLVVAILSATYLEANYEKDVLGDRAAGYRTLAHVIGLRASALVRMAGGVAAFVLAERFALLEARWLFGLAGGLLAISVGWVLLRPSAALVSYRFAVHATTLALCGLSERVLGSVGAWVAAAVGVALVERAFSLSENP